MGTDIHGVFQRRNPTTSTWEDIASDYEQHRHYQLFAVLAGVRNGFGFAGIVTGEPVRPIAEPRGFPADFDIICDDLHPIRSIERVDPHRRAHHDALTIWMGEHTRSWLSGKEMLAWFENAPSVLQTGVLSREEYEAWDKQSSPTCYGSDVSGKGVVLINDNQIEREAKPDWNYIRCEWTQSLRDELVYFFDEVRRLAAEHNEVRFVFGFDS